MQRYSAGTSFRVFLISGRVFVFNGGDSMTFYVPYIKKVYGFATQEENLTIFLGKMKIYT